eukprot:529796-Rhodomonas_salina.3
MVSHCRPGQQRHGPGRQCTGSSASPSLRVAAAAHSDSELRPGPARFKPEFGIHCTQAGCTAAALSGTGPGDRAHRARIVSGSVQDYCSLVK